MCGDFSDHYLGVKIAKKYNLYVLTLSHNFINDGVLLAFLAVSGRFWQDLVLLLFSPYIIPQG